MSTSSNSPDAKSDQKILTLKKKKDESSEESPEESKEDDEEFEESLSSNKEMDDLVAPFAQKAQISTEKLSKTDADQDLIFLSPYHPYGKNKQLHERDRFSQVLQFCIKQGKGAYKFNVTVDQAIEEFAQRLAQKIKGKVCTEVSYRVCCIPSSTPGKYGNIEKVAIKVVEKLRNQGKQVDYSRAITRKKQVKPQAQNSRRTDEEHEDSTEITIPEVQKRHIILFDDVYTTGNTLKVTTKMLKEAFAESVICAVIGKSS